MSLNKSGFWLPFTQMKDVLTKPEIVKGEGIYLYTGENKKIMDCISSWWVTVHGHGNKVVADAISNQAHVLEQVICAGFTHPGAEILAEKLIKVLPDGLNHMFYSDNGSTAVEVGLKMAFQYFRNKGDFSRKKFIAFENAYHGDTIGAMSVGGRSIFTEHFSNLMFETLYIPYPSTWIGDRECELKEKQSMAELDFVLSSEADEIAGLIIEPLVQGAGGMNMVRPEFLQKIEIKMKEYKIPVIYDEVMTGFGRTGEIFASVKAKTNPDIVCLSKGITGGFLPLAGTFCTDDIYMSFYSDDPLKTFYHGHSYTANPLGCAAGIASIELLLENEPYKKIENWHYEETEKFKDIEIIEKIRICGTIMALEIKSSKGGYLDNIGSKIRQRFLEDGFLLRPLGNVLYILPPYCITREELSLVYDEIVRVLGSI